jgi:hypothetical protein
VSAVSRYAPRPVALAILHMAEHLTDVEKRRARVALALRANDEGFALAETFQVDPRRFRESAVLDALESLAGRLDASHVIVVGDIDAERVEEIAARIRMTVEWLPYQAVSGSAEDQTRSKLST